MSSIGSATSTIISYNGEEIELETALDELYKDIQQNLNHSQCSVREMARSKEDSDFFECVPIHWAILDYVENLNELFKELTDISSQVLGKPNKDENRKIRKKREKLELKEQEKLKSIKE
jgi:hypothetical protein